jgi:predicted Fe-Mo cluster-binding NifX family protein
MNIAITASGTNLEAPFSPRFGRCDTFILIDSETREWQTLPNPAGSARGGAGPQAAQYITNQGAQVVISGRYGPSAFTALQTAGIQTYLAKSGTVNEVLEQYLAGELESTSAPTGPELHGRGRRRS